MTIAVVPAVPAVWLGFPREVVPLLLVAGFLLHTGALFVGMGFAASAQLPPELGLTTRRERAGWTLSPVNLQRWNALEGNSRYRIGPPVVATTITAISAVGLTAMMVF